MSLYKQEYLEKYLKLAVVSGTGLQKGQKLMITASVDNAAYARIAVDYAYAAGAKEVVMRWQDDKIMRSTFLHADPSVFDAFPSWSAVMVNELSAEGCANLNLVSSDPEALKGVEIDRIVRFNKARDKAVKPFHDRMMSSQVQWSIAAIPGEAWAKKVFPNDTNAMELLWDAIFAASRVDDNDPIENWRKHQGEMQRHVTELNKYGFEYLHITNGVGTDIKIGLPKNHVWAGGSDKSADGVDFLPNIPTEEIFTAPQRNAVDGIVVGSKPMVYNGNLIEDFSITFKDGKVVSFTAKQGYDMMEQLITATENMNYLGEVALVPYHSPISQMDILFYNTLFDENASCHLALGCAYPSCVEGGANMSDDEKTAAGLNVSDGHHDFMFGTADMQITGVTSTGQKVQVFKDGDFAF